MYEFMKQTVVECAFILIIAMDTFGIGYMVYDFVRWVKKRKHGDEPDVAETEAGGTGTT